MNQIIKIPKRLLEAREEVLRGFGNAPGTDYDKGLWQIYLKEDSNLVEDLNLIAEEFPGRLKRGDLELLSVRAIDGEYPQIRRLFLASMIWGWGNRGRGMVNTRDALLYDSAEEILRMAVSLITKGSVVEAYERFRLPYCGPAFFTKFFYFIGLGAKIMPLPVILDAKVANSLEMLGTEEGWDLSIFAKMNGNKDYVRRYPEGYGRYIESMDKWAKELGQDCRADYIEYFLFSLMESSGKRPKEGVCR